MTFPAQKLSYLTELQNLTKATASNTTASTTVTTSAGLAMSAILVIVAMSAFVITRMGMSMEKLTKFFRKCYDCFIAVTGYVVIACDKVKEYATRLKDFTVALVNVVVNHFNKKR